jgi:hypothetical protein
MIQIVQNLYFRKLSTCTLIKLIKTCIGIYLAFKICKKGKDLPFKQLHDI